MIIQMPIDFDKYIYHFTKAETALLYIIPSLKLRLNSYLTSNDPKENRSFGDWSIFEDCSEFKQSEIRNRFESYMKMNCKHLCFSQDYVDPMTRNYIIGFNHPSMWAHYADNSKGVCMAINKTQFIQDNPNLIKDNVCYSSVLRFPKMDETKCEQGEEYFKDFLRCNKNEMFYRKFSHWEIEHEYKVIELGHKEYCSIDKSLVGICLGADFDLSLISLLKSILPKHVGIEKTTISDGMFYFYPISMFNIEAIQK